MQQSLAQRDQDKDKPLTSIFQLASIVDTLRQDDVMLNFQRVTITGEETSGVSCDHGTMPAESPFCLCHAKR